MKAFRQSLPGYYSLRVSYDGRVFGYILGNHATRTNNSPLAKGNCTDHRGIRADDNVIFDRRRSISCSTDSHTLHDCYVVAEHSIAIDDDTPSMQQFESSPNAKCPRKIDAASPLSTAVPNSHKKQEGSRPAGVSFSGSLSQPQSEYRPEGGIGKPGDEPLGN